MTDRIRGKNLFHGVSDAQQALEQRYFVDIDCEIARLASDCDYAALCDLAFLISHVGVEVESRRGD